MEQEMERLRELAKVKSLLTHDGFWPNISLFSVGISFIDRHCSICSLASSSFIAHQAL